MSHRPLQLAGIIRSLIARKTVEIPPSTATGVSIIKVDLSSDLSFADIYVSAITGVEEAVKFLKSKSPAIRKEIASGIQAHKIPFLRFHLDTRGEELDRLDQLLRKL